MRATPGRFTVWFNHTVKTRMPDAPIPTEPTRDPGRDRDTEERILAAAHAVFLRHGAHGARMQDIADEAGVNKALLHYYFRSKDRLAEEVFRRTFAGIIPVVMHVLGSELPLGMPGFGENLL